MLRLPPIPIVALRCRKQKRNSAKRLPPPDLTGGWLTRATPEPFRPSDPQQQAERVAALEITDQRKEPAPAQPQPWRRWLRTLTDDLLFLWIVGLMCGGVLFLALKGGS
jgi:hypothetical protein